MAGGALETVGKDTESTPTRKSFRCKSTMGYSCRWEVGKTSKGDFKALSVGKVKVRGQPIPSCFLPFEIMDAVMNTHIRFGSLADAEAYVRSL